MLWLLIDLKPQFRYSSIEVLSNFIAPGSPKYNGVELTLKVIFMDHYYMWHTHIYDGMDDLSIYFMAFSVW